MNLAVCTIFEGSYHLGVGALANSLSRNGYRSTLWAGYRGPLPPWAGAALEESPGRHRLKVTPDFSILFVALETQEHFAYYKPALMERVLTKFDTTCDGVIYIDPDIVVKCPWDVFGRWLNDGIALVEDINPSMPASHPQRRGWVQTLEKQGFKTQQNLERYYNSGFVGVPRSKIDFLGSWKSAMALVLQELGGAHSNIKFGHPTDIYHTPDQDAMNMACMLTAHRLNTAGPEAMDFLPGGHYLSHAVGTPKPWQGGFIKRALRGYPPSMAAKEYLNYTQEPIAALPASRFRALSRAIRLAALIGRFYRRT
jgi:hypothetical protein